MFIQYKRQFSFFFVGLLFKIFNILYEDNVISHDGLLKWSSSEEPAANKGKFSFNNDDFNL